MNSYRVIASSAVLLFLGVAAYPSTTRAELPWQLPAASANQPPLQRRCTPPEEEKACTAECPVLVEASGEQIGDVRISVASVGVYEHFDQALKRTILIGTITCEAALECEGAAVGPDPGRPPVCKQDLRYVAGCEGIPLPGTPRSIFIRKSWEIPVSWLTGPSPEMKKSLLAGETFYVSSWCAKDAEKNPDNVPDLNCADTVGQNPEVIESRNAVGCTIVQPPGDGSTLSEASNGIESAAE